MIRRSPRHRGVYQRCRSGAPPDGCPPDRCRDHRWAYSVELPPGAEGKRRQISKGGFDTARDAADARAEVIRRDRSGELPADNKITLGEWLPRWLAGRVDRGDLAPATVRSYRDFINSYLIPKLGHRKLAQLRPLHITDALAEVVTERKAATEAAQARNAEYARQAEATNRKRAERGKVRMVPPHRVAVPRPIGPSTVRRIHACLSAALKSAVQAGMIPANPAQHARLPKVVKRKVQPAEPAVYGAFLDQVEGDRLYAAWVLFGHSGLRRGELAGLKWSDVDLTTGRVVVDRQRVSVGYVVHEHDAKTEAGQGRVVYLDQDTLAVLKAWRRQQLEERMQWGPAYRDQGYVFTWQDGRPYHPEYITKRYGRLARKHGMPSTRVHALRHFRASALISNGAGEAAVSKTLGHKTVAVTVDIYGHLFDSAAEQLAETAAGYVPRRARTA